MKGKPVESKKRPQVVQAKARFEESLDPLKSPSPAATKARSEQLRRMRTQQREDAFKL